MGNEMGQLTENTRILILDTSKIVDFVDYGGMLYELKKVGIVDGVDFQIDNSNDLLMNDKSYEKCKNILVKFKIKVVN